MNYMNQNCTQISGNTTGCMVGVTNGLPVNAKSRYTCGKGGFPSAMAPIVQKRDVIESFGGMMALTGTVRPGFMGRGWAPVNSVGVL
jgi:hypothetical protein